MPSDERSVAPSTEARNSRARINRDLRKQRIAAAREKGRHSKGAWLELLAECGGVCPRCLGEDLWLEKDHIVPIYQGGSDGLDNIQPLCARCNSSKGPENYNWLNHRRSNGWHR